jgi:hypothetical protein
MSLTASMVFRIRARSWQGGKCKRQLTSHTRHDLRLLAQREAVVLQCRSRKGSEGKGCQLHKSYAHGSTVSARLAGEEVDSYARPTLNHVRGSEGLRTCY